MLTRGINPGINLRPSPVPNFSNPWEMNSWAQAGVRNTEDELTSGILGTNHKDPNILRHLLFQFMALIGLEYGFEDERISTEEENKKAIAKGQQALPAEIAMA